MSDIEVAVAEFRRRLRAEAKLAECDLDELEEHLRELTDELRVAGMSAAEAVSEAARRLGDPCQLAREHVRVRSPFGAPLSAGRAWSAAALLAIPIIVGLVITNGAEASGPRLPLRAWFDFGAFILMPIALATRRTWARGLVLGMTLYFLTNGLAQSVLFPWHPHPPSWVWLVPLGVLAFVTPWRRKEISLAAVSLALQVWAYASAAWGMDVAFSKAYETNLTVAYVCAGTACIGTVLRARWSAIASAVSAVALFGIMFSELGELFLSRSELDVWWAYTFGKFGSAATAASVAAILAWRTTRAARGTFRSLTQTQ